MVSDNLNSGHFDYTLIKLERLNQEWVIGMVYSVNGFYKNAIQFLEKHGIAWSEHDAWLDNQYNRT